MQNINKRNILIGTLVLFGIAIIIAGWIFTSRSGNTDTPNAEEEQFSSTDDPVSIALDFYEPWLNAVQSTSTDPYQLGYQNSPILSKTLREHIAQSAGRAETEIDPVLCQATVPSRVTGRVVTQQEHIAQVLIMARESEITAQSVFTLKRHNNGWYIDTISCTPGEFEAPREFSFEQEGFLLKDVPEPLNAEFWHIVFERDGTQGRFAPLFFDSESMCTALDGTESVCDPSQLIETSKAMIRGQMTESGVEVKYLSIIE